MSGRYRRPAAQEPAGSGKRRPRPDRSGVQAGGLGPGTYSVPNGWDGDWHRAPDPSRQWNGGPVSQRWCPNCPPGGWDPMRIQGCLRTGSGVPAVAPSIILSQIGAVRPMAGVIRSQPGVQSPQLGFSVDHTMCVVLATSLRSKTPFERRLSNSWSAPCEPSVMCGRPRRSKSDLVCCAAVGCGHVSGLRCAAL